MSKTKAIFLDRDGVLNKLIIRNGKAQAPYNLDEFELYPEVLNACNLLKAENYLLVVVTNQPDVARGWVSLASVELINNKILEVLPIDLIKVCLHVNSDNCQCRKPMPGMLLAAATELNIDLEKSFMIGDRYSDIEAGSRAGCKTILVGPGDEQGIYPTPDFKVDLLVDAAKIILEKFL